MKSKQGRTQPPSQGKPAIKKGKTKEDAIKEMVEKNPEKAAQMLREILKGR